MDIVWDITDSVQLCGSAVRINAEDATQNAGGDDVDYAFMWLSKTW